MCSLKQGIRGRPVWTWVEGFTTFWHKDYLLFRATTALVPIDEADGPRGCVGAGLGCCHAFDPTCLRATLLTVRNGAQCVILGRGRSPGLWRSQAGMIAVSVLGRRGRWSFFSRTEVSNCGLEALAPKDRNRLQVQVGSENWLVPFRPHSLLSDSGQAPRQAAGAALKYTGSPSLQGLAHGLQSRHFAQ